MGCINCSCGNYPRLKPAAFTPTGTQTIMVIGESPTAIETRNDRVMSGGGAVVLKETMEKVGIPKGEEYVYYTTALKCAIPKKKGQKAPADAPGWCREFLLAEIREVKPSLILVCGAVALQTLTNDKKIKVTMEYGRVREYPFAPGAKVIPIMNPGVLMHKPGDYKPFLSMMQLAATIYNGGTEVDTGSTTWTILDTPEKVKALWDKMMRMNKEGLLDKAAYDVETTGLDYRVVDFLVMGICFEKNHTYVIPREMKNFAHNFLNKVPWKCLWQHGKYDKKVLWRRGLGEVPIDEDTIYMHYVLDETTEHNLGYLAKTFLNAAEYKFKMDQNWKVMTLERYEEFKDALCERVAVDCDYTLQLCDVFYAVLNKPGNEKLLNLYQNFLIPASNYLARVEQNGMLLNPEYLNVMDKQYVIQLSGIMDEVLEEARLFWDPVEYQRVSGAKKLPSHFNPGSPKQMSWMVFDRLKLKPRIKKGKSTAKEILNSIPNPPLLVRKVMEYRKVKKEHSTYVLGLLNARDVDGRVRSNFNLHIAATGRLSSSDPNVQNQPAANSLGNIRKAFVAKPGYLLAEIDYSGAELRWLAFLSGCPVLSDVFIQDRNLHDETATALYGEHYSKKQKMRAKAVNFGIPYGREAPSLAEEFDITKEEAQGMIDGWLGKYPGASKYLKWCAEQVELGNYLETPFGRRRRFGLVTPQSLHGLQNEAKNFPIQSSSSDLLLWCCIQLEEKLLAYDTHMLNLIHDSTILEIPADLETLKKVGILANAVMTEAPVKLFDCPIPFKTDFEVGLNWGELTSFNCLTGNMEVEQEDDTIKEIPFDEWYAKTTNKETYNDK